MRVDIAEQQGEEADIDGCRLRLHLPGARQGERQPRQLGARHRQEMQVDAIVLHAATGGAGNELVDLALDHVLIHPEWRGQQK